MCQSYNGDGRILAALFTSVALTTTQLTADKWKMNKKKNRGHFNNLCKLTEMSAVLYYFFFKVDISFARSSAFYLSFVCLRCLPLCSSKRTLLLLLWLHRLHFSAPFSLNCLWSQTSKLISLRNIFDNQESTFAHFLCHLSSLTILCSWLAWKNSLFADGCISCLTDCRCLCRCVPCIDLVCNALYNSIIIFRDGVRACEGRQ